MSTLAEWLVVRLRRGADRTEDLADWVERKFYRP